MILNGFGFSGYRSFGDELTKIAPLKKVNLIIGQNNVGKSNIISFLSKQYAYFVSKVSDQMTPPQTPFESIDYRLSQNKVKHRIAFPIISNYLEDYISKKLPDNIEIRPLAMKLLTSDHFVDEKRNVWFTYVSTSNANCNFKLEVSNDTIPSLIMFDSDKDKPRARLTKTKQRLKREFDSGEGFAWVTKVREVENYLDYNEIEESVKIVHPSASRLFHKDQWANLLEYKKNRSNDKRTASKVKVARHYVSHYEVNLEVLDLNEQVSKLCNFIDQVNGEKN